MRTDEKGKRKEGLPTLAAAARGKGKEEIFKLGKFSSSSSFRPSGKWTFFIENPIFADGKAEGGEDALCTIEEGRKKVPSPAFECAGVKKAEEGKFLFGKPWS